MVRDGAAVRALVWHGTCCDKRWYRVTFPPLATTFLAPKTPVFLVCSMDDFKAENQLSDIGDPPTPWDEGTPMAKVRTTT